LALTIADLQRQGQQDEQEALLAEQTQARTGRQEERSERLLGIREAGERRAQQLFDIQNPVGPVQQEPLTLEEIKQEEVGIARESGGLEGALSVLDRFRIAEKGPDKATGKEPKEPFTGPQLSSAITGLQKRRVEEIIQRSGFSDLEALQAGAKDNDPQALQSMFEINRVLSGEFRAAAGAPGLDTLRAALPERFAPEEQTQTGALGLENRIKEFIQTQGRNFEGQSTTDQFNPADFAPAVEFTPEQIEAELRRRGVSP
jgi:hypothetical protein